MRFFCVPKPPKPWLTCQHCDHEFKGEVRLTEHQRRVHCHRCRCCFSVFPTAQQLVDHTTKWHPDNICLYCKDSFGYDELRKHYEDRTCRPWGCNLCEAQFPNKPAALLHLKEAHPNRKRSPERESSSGLGVVGGTVIASAMGVPFPQSVMLGALGSSLFK